MATVLPDPARALPGRSHRDGQPTERAAAIGVMPRSGSQRYAVLVELRLRGERGATDYELYAEAAIGARPHVPGTRREELIRDGWPIVDSGQRRETDTGALAIVWTLREGEPEALDPGLGVLEGDAPSPSRSDHHPSDRSAANGSRDASSPDPNGDSAPALFDLPPPRELWA